MKTWKNRMSDINLVLINRKLVIFYIINFSNKSVVKWFVGNEEEKQFGVKFQLRILNKAIIVLFYTT